MVYWFLSSFVSASLQVLIEKFVNLGIIGYKSVSNVDDKLKKLERTLLRIQALLRDAEDKQTTDKAWQISLRDLEELAYDADDLIDETAIKVSQLDNGNHNYKDQVCNLLLSLFKSLSGPNMNSIQAKMDGILKEMDSLCLREIVQGRHLNTIESTLQSSSFSDETLLFGRDGEMNELKGMLLGDQLMENKVSVIPIVGMADVGKTTLAQFLYNDPDIHSRFSCKMWVCVTKDFDVVRLTKSILYASTWKFGDASDLNTLQNHLRESFMRRKYLLVLDDLWNEKQNEWEVLLNPLRVGSNGSKIVVTTRNQKVASMVSTDQTYNLKCLSDQDCWSLLREKALGNSAWAPSVISNFENIGNEIAEKCDGLPLAAKILGRVLQSKKDGFEWEAMLKKNLWDFQEVKNEIIPSLRLSYLHLPPQLKQCFAYCSMFPQSHVFEKDKLVQMWIGERFIQPEGRRMMEDIGSDYFDQLFSMSFFRKHGEVYKMHGAVHNLAESVSGDKFFRMGENDDLQSSCIHRNTRHSSLLCGYIDARSLEAFDKCKSLRSLMVLSDRETGTSIKDVPFALFHKLGRLRVLDLSNTQIQQLAANIGNLKHLRFLDLSKTPLMLLPDTTRELCSLHRLKLLRCSKLLCLPEQLGRLTSLKHLEFGGNGKLTSMPCGIGTLVGLQTLSEFIVGPESGQLNELRGLNMLRGTLCIKQLEKVKNPQEAEEAKLVDKRYLDKLQLQWSCTVDVHSEEHVLNNLKPNLSLKELTLKRYGGRMFPTWVSNPLFAELKSICLDECGNCVLLPTLGQLPKLRSLKIVRMHVLTSVDNRFFGDSEGGAFPSLELLELRELPRLESWSVALRPNDMEYLCNISILKCPRLNIIPSLHCLKNILNLKFEKCPQLRSFTDTEFSQKVESLIITECPLLCNNLEGQIRIENAHYVTIDYVIRRF